MQAKHYEEFSVGERFSTRARTITEADIVSFAGLSGDFNPLHTDEEYARKTPFGKRVAHGLLGLAVHSGLVQGLGITEGTLVAFLGLTWSFKAPIFIGDTIRVVQSVESLRETRNPERGIVVFACTVLNQRGETVQEGNKTLMIRRRPPSVDREAPGQDLHPRPAGGPACTA